MGKIVVLGCGYVGQTLARSLKESGHAVRATTTTEAKRPDLAALGVEAVLVRTDDQQALSSALGDATAVVHLAPPDPAFPIEEQTKRIASACGPDLRVYLYGSTTGAFGQPGEPGVWIDETTPSRNLGARGQKRLDFERGLVANELPLRTVRIAGIYGPGRTLRRSIEANTLTLFDDGPPTSRIHVDDLSRLLEAMLNDQAPPLAIACDDEPAPTLEVARYTCELLGRSAPASMSIAEAKKVMSDAAIEMRLGGRRCRSIVREGLIGPLRFPTYREGVRASLEAEGALTRR